MTHIKNFDYFRSKLWQDHFKGKNKQVDYEKAKQEPVRAVEFLALAAMCDYQADIIAELEEKMKELEARQNRTVKLEELVGDSELEKLKDLFNPKQP